MQNDVVYLALIAGLFALMLGLVWACDRIIGSDEEALAEEGADPGPGSVAGRDGDRVAA